MLACLAVLAMSPAVAQQSFDMNELREQWASNTRSEFTLSPEDIFERLDANQDGQVTSEEVPADGLWFLERFDRDGGGVITFEEIGLEIKDAITRQANRDHNSNRPTGPRALFERTAPKLGDLLPEISAYRADGEAFNLSSLKGIFRPGLWLPHLTALSV